jgi:glycosyltransferase involved in cell wall biosynthesis
MHQKYEDWCRVFGCPAVSLSIVAVYEQSLAIFAPPLFPSLFSSRGGSWLTFKYIAPWIGEQLIGETFWTPLRCFPVITLRLQGIWHIWTTTGLVACTPATWYDLVQGRLQPAEDTIDIAAFSLQEVLVALGYPLASSPPQSLQEGLSRRSNDYWIIERLCTLLTGLDLISGDAAQLDWYEGQGSLSVVIPGYNIEGTLSDVLASLYVAIRHLPRKVSCEVIVVDDQSTVPLSREKLPFPVRLVRSEQQLFCAGARNIGLMVARGETVLFLDGDTLVAPNYLINHWIRHRLFPGLMLVSLREYLSSGTRPPARQPHLSQDSRWHATYTPGWKGLTPVSEVTSVSPLAESDHFRCFGYGRKIGPTDLPFMVKGNNLSLSKQACMTVRFPSHFQGWGPEDVCFAAKMIALGHFVVPVLSTGVFHLNHLPRSGSQDQQEQELITNLRRYATALQTSPYEDWKVSI